MGDYATTELSDALIKLGVKHGGYLSDIQQYSPVGAVRISGPAYTVQMVPFNDTTSPKPTQHFVDAAPAGHVIVINVPPDVKSAAWGGLMTLGAQSRGAVGVVVAGRCRDIVEHRAVGFAVFARGQSTLGQRPFTRPSALNVPLTISSSISAGDARATGASSSSSPLPPPLSSTSTSTSSSTGGSGSGSGQSSSDVEVKPGDWIVADEDGVVCVPREILGHVCAMAERGRREDEKCRSDIIAGKGVQASFDKWRAKL